MHLSLGWRALDIEGMEQLDLRGDVSGIAANGVIVANSEGAPLGLAYEILLTPDWLFRRLTLRRTDGAGLELHSDGAGNWTAGDGTALPGLQGCLDIDLGGSPFTNSLPINRTAWVDLRPERFDMARIDSETLTPQRDGQIYTRLRPDRFRYQAADSRFEAEIAVDAAGLVTSYPGLFERL